MLGRGREVTAPPRPTATAAKLIVEGGRWAHKEEGANDVFW